MAAAAAAAAGGQRPGAAASPLALALGLLAAAQVCGDQNQGAVFLREFTLIRRENLHDDFLSDLLNNHKTEDPVEFTLSWLTTEGILPAHLGMNSPMEALT